ncbi:MAG TPA: four helix bundle protein [Chloroflexia bacterium]|nr:four helix bundle protein [Chloroflexia bacterium]
MNYQEWEVSVPDAIRDDSLWKAKVYRLALFASEMGWQDATKVLEDRRTRSLSDQLYRSIGSISANIAEGYSRGTSRDRAHFYEYALGSAREARDWYYKARYILSDDDTAHRVNYLSEIIRLLLVMVPDQRGRVLKEDTVEYIIDPD